ncbi:hypothetical protein [Helicobacter acinonychis]|uniref:hypothetical protein n=1 Tax=Helicobacter acinonychis TaxID=212 RepID=UPI001F23CDAA|nr:hypothetical protein [Helicobacter acinonychis]
MSALDEEFIEFYREATEKEFNTLTAKIHKTLDREIEIKINYADIKPVNLKKINLILKKENDNSSRLDTFLILMIKINLKITPKILKAPYIPITLLK